MFEHLGDPSPRQAPDTLLADVISKARGRHQRRVAVAGAACMIALVGLLGATQALSFDGDSRRRLVMASPSSTRATSTSVPVTLATPDTVVTAPSSASSMPTTSMARTKTPPPPTATTKPPLRGDATIHCGTIFRNDAYVIGEPSEQDRPALDCLVGGFARNAERPDDPVHYTLTEREFQINGTERVVTYNAGYPMVRVTTRNGSGDVTAQDCRKLYIADGNHLCTEECTDVSP